MSTHLHSVTWSDAGEATFVCRGDRTASCHRFPDCDWDDDHDDHEHPNVEHDEACWVLSWLTACEPEDTYSSMAAPTETLGDVPQRNEAIDYEWDGDGLTWWYASLASEPTS